MYDLNLDRRYASSEVECQFLSANESYKGKDVVDAYVCKTEVMWTLVLLIINSFEVTSTTDKGSCYVDTMQMDAGNQMIRFLLQAFQFYLAFL